MFCLRKGEPQAHCTDTRIVCRISGKSDCLSGVLGKGFVVSAGNRTGKGDATLAKALRISPRMSSESQASRGDLG